MGESLLELSFACLSVRIMLLVNFMHFWFSSSGCCELASSYDCGVPLTLHSYLYLTNIHTLCTMLKSRNKTSPYTSHVCRRGNAMNIMFYFISLFHYLYIKHDIK